MSPLRALAMLLAFFAWTISSVVSSALPGSSLPLLPPSTKRFVLRHGAHGEEETEVFLCGTAHVSTRSCAEVAQVIRAVQPEVVMVELCSQRLPMLKDPRALDTTGSTSKDSDGNSISSNNKDNGNVTLRSSMRAVRRGEVGPLEAVLMWMQASSARVLDVLPGEEFRVALAEARACGADFLLADRPCQVTLRRMYESLGTWQRVRLLIAVAWSSFFLSPRALRKWLDKQLDDGDVISEEIQRLGKSFPTLVRTLIDERDMYMVARLREAAVVLRAKKLVVVVGAGHVRGMLALSESVDGAPPRPFGDVELKALSQSASGMECYSTYPTCVTQDMLDYVCSGEEIERAKLDAQANGSADQKAAIEGAATPSAATDQQAELVSTTPDASPVAANEAETALRFQPGDFVLVRDPAGLLLRGQVVRCHYCVEDEEWKAANPQLPSVVAYLVATELGEYVAAPLDSEGCISKDEFRPRSRR